MFYGHAKKSAEIAEPILRQLGYADHETQIICFFIAHHDDVIPFVLPTEAYDRDNPYLVEITERNVREHIDRIRQVIPPDAEWYRDKLWGSVIKLCCADARAQAEFVFRDDVQIDSREHKLEKVRALEQVIFALISDRNL